MLQTGIEIFNGIKSEFIAAERSIFIASAYCTKKAFDSLNSGLSTKVPKKILVVRWEPYDLLQGSSDSEVYLSAKNLGWKMFINQRLHAKTAIFDGVRAVIGSANYTESGMGLLGARSNLETTIKVPVTAEFLAWQDLLLKDSIEITDELYELITKEIAVFTPEWKPKIAFSFTEELQQKMRESQGALYTKDFVWCKQPQLLNSTPDDNIKHDLELLGLSPNATLEEMAEAFKKLKIYGWVETNLEAELYFGQFSAILHNALQDDPKPYRQNVKSLVANLIEWLAILYPTKFKKEQPNYSTKIVRI